MFRVSKCPSSGLKYGEIPHLMSRIFQACGRQIRGVRWVDFFLFPRLKSIMKGACFAGVAAIQERVRAVLRSIPKEAFADRFQKLYERCQQCVVKGGDYFEGL
jgi:hypothetical protein